MIGNLALDMVPGTDPALKAALEIRQEVFVIEQGVDPEEEIDDYDGICWHALAYLGDQAVGTARFVTLDHLTGKIGRVAVRREARGKGIASHLMRLLEDYAKREGMARLVLDAQIQVMPLYEKLGYVEEGEPFLDAGIVHKRMTKRITGS